MSGLSTTGLPRTDDLTRPPTYLLKTLAPVCRTILRRRFQIEVRGALHIPSAGPVVMAANHMGWLDGPMLAIFAPRPLHALTKQEMFSGALGAFLAQSGQIPVDRFRTDPRAVRYCLKVLRDGGLVGVFPEGSRGDGEMHQAKGGAAYLAMATGAPVVPAAFVGTRLPGGRNDSVPPRGSRLVLAYGEPMHLPRVEWPRHHEQVREHTERIRAAIGDLVRRTAADTGLPMPGPLPDPEDADEVRR